MVSVVLEIVSYISRLRAGPRWHPLHYLDYLDSHISEFLDGVSNALSSNVNENTSHSDEIRVCASKYTFTP